VFCSNRHQPKFNKGIPALVAFEPYVSIKKIFVFSCYQPEGPTPQETRQKVKMSVTNRRNVSESLIPANVINTIIELRVTRKKHKP
jgi:hypothetical protein